MTSANNKQNIILWQQIIAVDVKYNSFRNSNFKNLYIKRRNQLIGKIARKDCHEFRKQYFALRCQILNSKYGISCDQISIRSKNSSHRGLNKFDDSLDQILFKKEFSQIHTNLDGFHPFILEKNHVVSGNCAFAGMHHIFDQHKDAVTGVKFANNDKSLLACCSLDGTLSICQLTPSPATVLYILKGHKAGVCNFEWSTSNDLIVSCSYDGSVKLWDSASGVCLRTILDPFESSITACTFQPNNNNMIVTGNDKGFIQILNVSTGIYAKEKISNESGKVLCLSFDCFGKILWAGDSKGCISSFVFDIKCGHFMKINKLLLVAGCPITNISYFTWTKKSIRRSSLLVNIACNALLLFEIKARNGQLELKQSFPIRHQNNELMIRSSFCPILSFSDGIYVVSGSEDTCVYFFNAEDNHGTKNKFVNKLQGHSFPVLDVCFNYDESLLASSDSKGNIIVWKKESI